MKKRRKKSKMGLVFIVLLFSLASFSMSYAMWTDNNQITGTIGTMEDFNYLCLEGYWPFNETSGTNVPDSSMNENDGTVYGATWIPGSGINGCLSFDGDNDYVSISDDNTLDITDKITVMAWVKINSFEASRFYTIAGKWNDRDGDTRGYLIGLSLKETTNPQPRFYISTDGTDFPSANSSLTLNLDTWYHIAGTYDGSNLKIYVDGQLKGTTALTTTINTNNQPVLLGGDRAGGSEGRYYDGFIDEVKIYSCCLSEEDILEECT